MAAGTHNLQAKLEGDGVFSGAGRLLRTPTGGLIAYGPAVPPNGRPGYATGCTFAHITATGAPVIYANVGTGSSCNFTPLCFLSSSSLSSELSSLVSSLLSSESSLLSSPSSPSGLSSEASSELSSLLSSPSSLLSSLGSSPPSSSPSSPPSSESSNPSSSSLLPSDCLECEPPLPEYIHVTLCGMGGDFAWLNRDHKLKEEAGICLWYLAIDEGEQGPPDVGDITLYRTAGLKWRVQVRTGVTGMCRLEFDGPQDACAPYAFYTQDYCTDAECLDGESCELSAAATCEVTEDGSACPSSSSSPSSSSEESSGSSPSSSSLESSSSVVG